MLYQIIMIYKKSWKYKLIKSYQKNLYRLQAIRDFSDVKRGNLGGYVSSYCNLSHKGDCWIYDEVLVTKNAKVSENAKIFGNAHIDDNARVYGDVIIYQHAYIFNNAKVYGNAVISGNAQIFENAQVYGDAIISGNTKVSENTCIFRLL